MPLALLPAVSGAAGIVTWVPNLFIPATGAALQPPLLFKVRLLSLPLGFLSLLLLAIELEQRLADAAISADNLFGLLGARSIILMAQITAGLGLIRKVCGLLRCHAIGYLLEEAIHFPILLPLRLSCLD